MPRIRVTTELKPAREVVILLDERICVSDLGSDHFRGHLMERIGWAVADADDTERRSRS
ncbi:MAG TPA: hypothetical protein VMD09_15430 [Solirubrobacteraceae bacterium]|nr:hypothetical protein [Solirubrobacteraceae bacterium]